MSSRSKEKVSSALRKFFKSPDNKQTNKAATTGKDGVTVGGTGNSTAATSGPSTASPAKRLRCAIAPTAQAQVSPAIQPPPASFLATKSVLISKNSSATTKNTKPSSTTSSSNTSTATSTTNKSASDSGSNGGTTPAGGAASSTGVVDVTIRSRRLMKEFRDIQRLHNQRTNPIFTVELVNDNLYEWYARLHVVDPESKLAQDMIELNVPHITLQLSFPENFPFAPPFMRVVEPRIEKGYVMDGGAICMELLTPRGWASAYTVEALMMQFSASLVKGHGRIARKPKNAKEFSRRTAELAFRSLVKTHDKYGWVTPALSDG